MALVDIEFMRTHLATWSTRQGTPKDAALILRYLEYSQAWEYAFNNGWPRTLECAQDWDAYNRDLKLRCRNLYATTYHRDGTVTVWSVHRQGWVRVHVTSMSDELLSTLTHGERSRIERMRAKAVRS